VLRQFSDSRQYWADARFYHSFKKVLYDEAGKERFPKYVFTKNLKEATPIGFNHTLANSHLIAVEGIV